LPGRRYVNVIVEPNPSCPDGCVQRFLAVGETRTVKRVLYSPGGYSPGGGDAIECDVEGLTGPRGDSCPARAVSVEDSGAGTALLLYGGDWGLRLRPRDGGAAVSEPYLLLDDDAVLA